MSRRNDVEATMERLRLVSCECSSLGLEEEDASEVVQTPAAVKAVRDYCCECHMSFGLAEKRFAVAVGKVAHEDCYVKIERRKRERHERFDRWIERTH